MAHNIFGFVARSDALCLAAADLVGAQVMPLALGFSFLPVTWALAGEDEQAPVEHLLRLTIPLIAWAERVSATHPLAYIETDYWGGPGAQAAIAWLGGQVVFGPLSTSNYREDGRFHPTPLLDGAINRALRILGVERGQARDEFEALELGRHRSNEDWLGRNFAD